jgi:NAD-dependent DNA ligase
MNYANLDPNFLPESLNLRRNFEKTVKSLTGICMGLMADNHLNEPEIEFLYQTLLEYKILLNEWPYSSIFSKLSNILEDGKASLDEIKEFECLLRDFLGGTLQDTGAVSGLSTSLPLDSNVDLTFKGKTFCLTGQFKYGTRNTCSLAVIQKGGIVKNSVVNDLDFLVIGELASKDWIETNYGRKIQKATNLRDSKKSKVLIVSESDWQRALES